jgi:5-formyltetrahydrofolate cyclo-ligase
MKETIRREIMEKSKNFSKLELLKKSKKIKKRLFSMKEFKQAKTILFYVSYENEVFTHNMIKECLLNGKHIVVPVSDTKNRQLILSILTSWDDLDFGAYGILEPKKDKIKEIPINKIEFIVVPGVVFDKQGHRIGHGLGYYDVLLKNNTNAFLVGLAFEEQIVEKISEEPHDIPVDKIVTEKRIIG